MKREKIKRFLEDISFIVGLVICVIAFEHIILWLCREYLTPHMWEAFVDAVNRFFGG